MSPSLPDYDGGMEKRRLGGSDLEVSVLGLGCNNFGMKIGLDETRAVVDAAIDAGIDFLDTADMYGETQSEQFLGEVLEGRRDSVLLATKFGGLAMVSGEKGWGRREAIVACVEASLQRLRTDRIDLYQLHYPDPDTPMEDTLGALDELVQAGKVRAVGCSNFTPDLLAEASAAPGARYQSIQNEWSLLNREVEGGLVAACEKQGVGFLPYFPLASGVLTGKYTRGAEFAQGTRLAAMGDYFGHFGSDENLQKAEALDAFARDCGHSLLELAFGWLASQPCVGSIIAGATRPDQVHANAAAMSWRLSQAELARVDGIVAPPA